ncbi:Uncharacterised protein [Mycobacteroides abscessus subsp. abscessus]|nr:Uncharacterised protein [Mycobacteroides abscessus subsp. abscessus]SHQ13288.1 Uncharacterised protein [Mycobacteroides abscessus subsp. abscessus]SHQ26384.1 Uncharacterised protein [Mycobacteroides abscessus subsp. abscessus]SHQ44607.1 Uncharacterised protein [Mycobacteroides abscessus subsp. abscessus]SHV52054.1 Uncharacterised protein [Mycobacteroides abscessus subsp. abscessus]
MRWRRDELAWGRANSHIHGLGEELERITPADPERAEDSDEQVYLISATEAKFARAINRVNGYLGDMDQGANFAPHGFQRAIAFPLRGPGGSHESLIGEGD